MSTQDFLNNILALASKLDMTKEDRQGIQSQIAIINSLVGLESTPYRDRLLEKVKLDLKNNLREIHTVSNLEKIALA